MRVIVEDEAAVERVRKRAGDRSATETIARLIAEADTKPMHTDAPHVLRPYEPPGSCAERAKDRRAKRKGVRS